MANAQQVTDTNLLALMALEDVDSDDQILNRNDSPVPVTNRRLDQIIRAPNFPNNANHNDDDNHFGTEDVIVGNGNPDDSDGEGPHRRVNADPPVTEKDLVFSPFHTVLRFGRTFKRAEVLGFGCLPVIIMAIAMQAQTGLEAVGLDVPTDLTAKTSEGHNGHTFGWYTLSEFFMTDSVPVQERDCLFLKSHVSYRRRHGGRQHGANEDPSNDFVRTVNFNNGVPIDSGNSSGTHALNCPAVKVIDSWGWLYHFFIGHGLTILNLVCSTSVLMCIRARRKKGLMFLLMLPSFLGVFLSIFQEIPMIFSYSYTGVFLADEMSEAAARIYHPFTIAPVWDETQFHGRCCGIYSPETWGFEIFPISCCNKTEFKCNGTFARKHEVYQEGCFKKEYNRVRKYEMYAILIQFLKLIGEMGLLWCLSDLSTYYYPRPDVQQNAMCSVRDFEVKSKGCARILGVTTDSGMMAIKLRSYAPRKYSVRTSQAGNVKTVNIRLTLGSHAGSIEVRRTREHPPAPFPVIETDHGRRNGLVFLVF